MLMSSGQPWGSLCSSGPVSARLEDLQYTLGEGPCVDAYRLDRPVLEPDLAHPEARRWVGFSGPAVDLGARAVFGFPLRAGAVRLGALNLYLDEARPLSVEQQADAVVMADVAAEWVLAAQADAPPDELSGRLQGGHLRLVVHQAAGMVSAQMDCTVAEALDRLRADAFASGRRLDDVAADVVDRRLRFHHSSGTRPTRPRMRSDQGG